MAKAVTSTYILLVFSRLDSEGLPSEPSLCRHFTVIIIEIHAITRA